MHRWVGAISRRLIAAMPTEAKQLEGKGVDDVYTQDLDSGKEEPIADSIKNHRMTAIPDPLALQSCTNNKISIKCSF